MIQIQFSTSTAFASGIIRRLTHSPWSHVDIVMPDGLLGVSGKDDSISDIGGVRIRPFNEWPYLTKPKVACLNCSADITDRIHAAAASQIGKPFDNSAMWGMLEDQALEKNRNWRDPNQWFCSELVAWALETGGLFPYPLAVLKNRISPADILLMINPFMSADNIRIFLQAETPESKS